MRPPEAEGIHQETLLKLGEAQEEQAEETAGPKSRTAFLWRRQGAFTGTHPCMHPVPASTTSHPSRTAPPPPRGPLHNQAHTGHPCAQPHPVFHKHTGMRTRMWRTHTGQELGSLWGARQGGFSAVVAQEVGRLDPSFGRDPVKMMAGVGLPGPSPRAIISQATWPC